MSFIAHQGKCLAQKLQQNVMTRVYSTTINSTTFKADQLTVSLTKSPKQKPEHDTLVFGKQFTDHMLEAPWTSSGGWKAPAIVPYHNLELAPSCSALHYALQCFEGMKAYKDAKGNIRLFRPDMNAKRLRLSSERLSLPSFDTNEFVECIKQLVKIEHDWIPTKRGYSLYIRPTMIATEEALGVAPPHSALFFVILSPVGPYYKEGFNPVSLYADTENVRAWPGGSGASKLGANYAPTIFPQQSASKRGYSQVMWLIGSEHNVSEVGTMNMFFFWINENGEKELVTAPLDGTILPGVTRDSILQLCRSWGEFKVSERPYTMRDVVKAIDEGRLLEAFGSGTAAIVSPVKAVYYVDKEYKIPLDKDDASAKAGKLTHRLLDTLLAIQYGEQEFSDWSVIIK